MTAKKDIYQPKKNEEKKEEKNHFENQMKDSLPLMKTSEFNELLSDFDKTNEKENNNLNIVDNNNNFVEDNNNKKDNNNFIVDNNNFNIEIIIV